MVKRKRSLFENSPQKRSKFQFSTSWNDENQPPKELWNDNLESIVPPLLDEPSQKPQAKRRKYSALMHESSAATMENPLTGTERQLLETLQDDELELTSDSLALDSLLNEHGEIDAPPNSPLDESLRRGKKRKRIVDTSVSHVDDGDNFRNDARQLSAPSFKRIKLDDCLQSAVITDDTSPSNTLAEDTNSTIENATFGSSHSQQQQQQEEESIQSQMERYNREQEKKWIHLQAHSNQEIGKEAYEFIPTTSRCHDASTSSSSLWDRYKDQNKKLHQLHKERQSRGPPIAAPSSCNDGDHDDDFAHQSSENGTRVELPWFLIPYSSPSNDMHSKADSIPPPPTSTTANDLIGKQFSISTRHGNTTTAKEETGDPNQHASSQGMDTPQTMMARWNPFSSVKERENEQ